MGERRASGESVIPYNRLSVIDNTYQGSSPRVLCVCSGGVLRSPTAAWVLGNAPYNYNTRSAGTEDYALIKVDEALLRWANLIVCMEQHHADKVTAMLNEFHAVREILVLKISDIYEYRNETLRRLINENYQQQRK